MLESIFSTTQATISLQNCLICIGVAIVLGIVISLTHKTTTKTLMGRNCFEILVI